MSVLSPSPAAGGVSRTFFTECLAADERVAQGIRSFLSRSSGRPNLWQFLFPGHLDRGRGDRNRDENHSAHSSDQLAVHCQAPQLPFGNMRALPGW